MSVTSTLETAMHNVEIEENLTINVDGSDHFAQRKFRETEHLNDDYTNTTEDVTKSIDFEF